MVENRERFLREQLGREIKVESCSEEHVATVHDIAQEAVIDPNNATAKEISTGFLVYPLSPEAYRRRQEGNNFFVTFEHQGNVEGFLMCYDKIFLNSLVEGGGIEHEDGIVQFLAEQEMDNFLFGDQIAISASNRVRTAGTMMMEEMFERMKGSGLHDMFVAILHKPVRNDVSISFVNRLDFSNVGEVTNSDGLVWGMYHLQLP